MMVRQIAAPLLLPIPAQRDDARARRPRRAAVPGDRHRARRLVRLAGNQFSVLRANAMLTGCCSRQSVYLRSCSQHDADEVSAARLERHALDSWADFLDLPGRHRRQQCLEPVSCRTEQGRARRDDANGEAFHHCS